MNFLHALHQLLGQAHQAAPQQLGNNTQAAQVYAKNPMDPSVMHTDPAQFGYPADISGNRLQVQQQHSSANLGVPYGPLPQGAPMNPGLTPIQGSMGARAFPQAPALSSPFRPQFNPQDSSTQQYWQ